MSNVLILAIAIQIAIILFIICGIVKRRKQHIKWQKSREKVYFFICILAQAVIGVYAIASTYKNEEWLIISIISVLTSINVYTQLVTDKRN